jgi:hypothetical protein
MQWTGPQCSADREGVRAIRWERIARYTANEAKEGGGGGTHKSVRYTD